MGMAKSHATDYQRNPSGVVIGIAITMAWQLAIVVILPIVVGSLADAKLRSSPTCVLIGLGVGALGMIVVVRRATQDLATYMQPPIKQESSHQE